MPFQNSSQQVVRLYCYETDFIKFLRDNNFNVKTLVQWQSLNQPIVSEASELIMFGGLLKIWL